MTTTHDGTNGASSGTSNRSTRRSMNLTTVGALLLFLASCLWGLGFYAQRVSIEHVSPLWATSLRFVVAAPIAVVTMVARRRRGIPWRAGVIIGVLLYVAFATQTVAMRFTPVTRVVLITGLYAVFTPLLQPLFKHPRPRAVQVLAAAIAFGGMALLTGTVGPSSSSHELVAGAVDTSVPLNVGDALTLIMAVIAAALVHLIGHAAQQRVDPYLLSATQIVVMLVCSLLGAFALEGAPPFLPPHHVDGATWGSLVYLAIFSTFVAFFLQTFGQRHVAPTTAGIIMMLETPIGVVSALVLLHETMSAWQWSGALLVCAGVVVAVRSEQPAPPAADVHAAAPAPTGAVS